MRGKPNRERQLLYTALAIGIGALLGAFVGWAFYRVGLGIVLGVVAGLFYAYLLGLLPAGLKLRPPARPRLGRRPGEAMSPEEAALYGKLLSRILGDRELADRLIEHERRLAPNASRVVLIQNAIDHLEYDRLGRG